MNQTPEDPQAPDTGGDDARYPTQPLPHGDGPPVDGRPVDGRPDPEPIPLPSLDDGPGRRSTLTGRLAVIAVVVLALVGAAAAFAVRGDDNKRAKEGVASLDGSGSDRSNGKKRSDGGQIAGGPQSDADIEDAMLAYAKCMREQGIDMPDPQFSGDGVVMEGDGQDDGGSPSDGEKFEVAQDACGHHMGEVNGDLPVLSSEEKAELQDQYLAMTKCLRARGYDMPDPVMDAKGGLVIDMTTGGPSKDDEEVLKDHRDCNVEAGLEEGPGGEPGKP